MPKWRIRITIEDYWDYVVEEPTRGAALDRARREWIERHRYRVDPTITASDEDEEAAEGDVG